MIEGHGKANSRQRLAEYAHCATTTKIESDEQRMRGSDLGGGRGRGGRGAGVRYGMGTYTR